ncbi:MAG TPA: hypothetical protein DEH02_08735 [Bacteroidales bacterium]|nr:MAG: hypothetical protein A2X01_08180 [Bacteroidetes bacterium GWF2_35_48]HBX51136.1 hypothetical protein [Bacteroidales bacterium]
MKKLEKVLLAIAFVIVPFILRAQPDPGAPGNDSGGPIVVGEGAPIEGGVVVMFVLAIGLIAYKWYSLKKKTAKL